MWKLYNKELEMNVEADPEGYKPRIHAVNWSAYPPRPKEVVEEEAERRRLYKVMDDWDRLRQLKQMTKPLPFNWWRLAEAGLLCTFAFLYPRITVGLFTFFAVWL